MSEIMTIFKHRKNNTVHFLNDSWAVETIFKTFGFRASSLIFL